MKLAVSKLGQKIEEFDFEDQISNLIEKVSLFVGRGEDCHIRLDDPKISRVHLEISCEKNRYLLKKKSSLGEVKVNGNQVNEVELSVGDLVTIGPFTLSVESLERSTKNREGQQIGNENSAGEKNASGDLNSETKTLDFSPEELKDSLSSGEEDGEGIEAPLESEIEEDAFAADDFNSDEGEQKSQKTEDFSLGTQSSVESFEAGSQDYPLSEYEEQDDSESMGEGTQVFQGFANFELHLEGKLAPYDKYLLTQNETYIGRDKEKCQIVLNDPEVSSVHCVIRKNNVTCTLEDLESSNGTILNGSRINQAELSNSDEFVVGDTSFTFNVTSKMLQSESERLMPVDENQVVEVEEVVEVGVDFNDPDGSAAELADYVQEESAFGEDLEAATAQPQSLIAKFKAMPPKKRMIYIAVLGLLVLLLTGEEEPAPQKAKTQKKKSLLLVDENKKEKPVKGSEKESKQSLNAKLEKLSAETREGLERRYQLGKALFYEGKYRESIYELEAIFKVIEDYKETRSIYNQAKEGLAQIEELERKRRKEIEAAERREKVKELVEKARLAVRDRQAELSRGLFAKILELDPENFDVPQLKLEIDAWVREEERKALEEEQKKAERRRMVDALRPGKNFFLQEKWYQAVLKLEQFLKAKKMDEDLIEEAKEMLDKSKEGLKSQVDPAIAKARSLKEGQDLKGAYEAYSDVIRIDPSNEEALNEVNSISDTIEARAKKLYREAIISESLSLFDEAKEKFQEVQQTSPSDSVYYKKATNKLREYIE